jgi:hypothetical protein
VQDGEEDGPLNGELEAALGQKLFEHGGTAGFLPESFEDQHGAEAERADDGKFAAFMGGEDEEFVGEACAGAEQSVDGAFLLEFIESSEGGEDGLLGPSVAPVILDELEVGAGTGFFGAEEHGGLRVQATRSVITSLANSSKKCRISGYNVALCFRPRREHLRKSRAFCTRHVRNGG